MSELSDTQSITRGAVLSANSVIRVTAGMGQTRTCLAVGASSAFTPLADIQCGCAVALFRQTGFWEHRPVKVKRSNGRAGRALSYFSALLLELPRYQGQTSATEPRCYLVTLCSASADQAVVLRASVRHLSTSLLFELSRWQGQSLLSAPEFRSFTLLPSSRHLRIKRSCAGEH